MLGDALIRSYTKANKIVAHEIISRRLNETATPAK